MAARKDRNVSEHARKKIRAAHLIRRMQQHIDGKITLTMAQVRGIDILLRKIVPDLVQSTVAAQVEHKYVVEVPPLLTKDEWQKKYLTRREPPTLELEAEPTPHLITSNTKQ